MTQIKIVMLPRLQIDSIIACFLLKYFGEEHFPGVSNAQHLFWIDIPADKNPRQLEKEGYIFLDMGGGIFDHHAEIYQANKKCMSQIVADFLGIEKKQSLRKLLEFARRDDLEGKGIISKDPIDRAFGLSGLMNNLNRTLPDDQQTVIATIMPLLLAHYLEEKKRTEDLPTEYRKRLDTGRAKKILIETIRGPIRMIYIETDEIAMAGFLRAKQEIAADIVIQKMSSRHVNIITQQQKSFDLSEIVRLLRRMEIQKKGGDITAFNPALLAEPGRIEGIEEWYFDTRAKTIQNGGIRPQWTNATSLTETEIINAIEQGAAIKL